MAKKFNLIKKFDDSHLCYVKFARSRYGSSEQIHDLIEARLFDALALIWSSQVKITVMDFVNGVKFCSTTTTHRKLMALKKKKLIRYVEDKKDARTKYITPTNAGVKYFQFLSEHLRLSFEG